VLGNGSFKGVVVVVALYRVLYSRDFVFGGVRVSCSLCHRHDRRLGPEVRDALR
jgi:hypothetical protein